MNRTWSRKPMRAVAVCAFVAGLSAACEAGPNRAAPDAASASGDIVPEAEEFMRTYAEDLLAGNRAAIGARYDDDGAYMVGNGRKALVSRDSIAARYQGAWTPPVTFEWQDLSYEPVGDDGVVVVGRFAWGAAGGARPLNVSYTSLLRRRDGGLRIRVEDESLDPASMRGPAPSDSAR